MKKDSAKDIKIAFCEGLNILGVERLLFLT